MTCQNHHRVAESAGKPSGKSALSTKPSGKSALSTKPSAKSALSTKHHEDNDISCKNFEFDIRTFSRGLPINPFVSTKLHKINNESTVVPDFVFERIKSIEDAGETQFKNFVNDRLIFGKKTISADIRTNKFKIWDFSVTDVEKPFAPTNNIINKMRPASEHRRHSMQKSCSRTKSSTLLKVWPVPLTQLTMVRNPI